MRTTEIIFAEPQFSEMLPKMIRKWAFKNERKLKATKILILDLAFPRDQKKPFFAEWLRQEILIFKYLDHHPHFFWEKLKSDQRFSLFPREKAQACPEIVDFKIGWNFDLIVTHIDFDGLMSAAKALGFYYAELENDARIFDNRLENIASEKGCIIEESIKGLDFFRQDKMLPSDAEKMQLLRRELFYNICDFIKNSAQKSKLNFYLQRYKDSEQVGEELYQKAKIHTSGLIIVAEETRPFDRPKWLSRLSRENRERCGIVFSPFTDLGKKMMAVSSSRPDRDNFPLLFGQKGGMATVTAVPRNFRNIRKLLRYCYKVSAGSKNN
ncbi:hypothetical protein ACFL35_13525 [Candidatus Riflebacteria bacterium]